MKSLCTLCVSLSFVLGSVKCIGLLQPVAGSRLVEINVVVKNESNQPLPDVVVTAFTSRRFSSGSDLIGDTTKADGTVKIKFCTGGPYGDQAYVTVRPHPLQDSQKYLEMYVNHGLSETYPVKFVEGVSSYPLTIQYRPTITASGTIDTASLSQAREVLVSASQAKSPVNSDGTFSLRGLPKNVGGVLYVLNGVTGNVTRKPVSARESSGDVAVGALTELSADETGRMKLTLRGSVPEVPDESSTRVVLVSTSGSRIYQFKVSSTGQVQAWNRTDDEVRLAQGEYFVFPGSITSMFAEKVIRLVLASRATDVSTGQVPKVTVTTDDPVVVEIDRAPVWSQIEQIVE